MKFRMTIYPAIEVKRQFKAFTFETAEQMIVSKDVAADLLLFIQDDMNVMCDYSNLFLLEEKVNGEWEEYEEF